MKKEENNGWIKIESEEDLPKEKFIELWIMAEDCIVPIYYEVYDEFSYDGSFGEITHYQPIIKPQPPIY